MAHPALGETAHRPWPLPTEPWVWRQVWNELAFLHWPVPAARIAHLVPRPLSLDEFDGQAWVAVTPFRISGASLRGVAPLPGLSAFPETNVRTYVRHGDRPGVWFFSLDAYSHLAVSGGRWLFELPYFYAEMHARRAGERIAYSVRRPTGERFAAMYQPIGPGRQSVLGSLEYFLTERYCLYAQSRAGRLHSADIHHVPWTLQRASIELERNDLLAANGISVDGSPMAHYSERIDVIIWPLKPAFVR